MYLILTLACIGLGLVAAEVDMLHAPAKMISFTSSHAGNHYIFAYEMDDGTMHREEGRLMDGVWVIESQFMCANDDSPMKAFVFMSDKCRMDKIRVASPDYTNNTDQSWGEPTDINSSEETEELRPRSDEPFSNNTDAPLKIGLPITTDKTNVTEPLSQIADVYNTTSESDVKLQPAETDIGRERDTATDDQLTDDGNQTQSEQRALEIADSDNQINKSNDDLDPPETIVLNKSDETSQINLPAAVNQLSDDIPTEKEETNEAAVQDGKMISSSESGDTVTMNSTNETLGNQSVDNPVIKPTQISTEHSEDLATVVNESNTPNDPQEDPIVVQEVSDNQYSNFQVLFTNAENTTADGDSQTIFPSTVEVNKEDGFYNNSRSFLEALLKTDNVAYSMNTEPIPINRNVSTMPTFTTAAPADKVEGVSN